MFSTNCTRSRVFAAIAAVIALAVSGVSRADTPHLTLDDIDQLSRDKVVRQLKGAADGAAPTSGAGPSAPLTTTPVVGTDPTPKDKPVRLDQPRSRAEPVTFVGAYSDATGGSVLYELNGGVYSAHIGVKLLNGWTARKVEGFVVTVAEGKRVWTETIQGGAAPDQASLPNSASSSALQVVRDLGGPLPPGVGATTPIFVSPGK